MPTALALSPEEWKQYVKSAQRRAEVPERSAEEHRSYEQILGRVREAAAVLKSRFGAQRVILFGSLALEAWFRPDSDIDLAVEGLDAQDYWKAWGVVEDLIGDRSVDLIALETVRPSLHESIRRHGIDL